MYGRTQRVSFSRPVFQQASGAGLYLYFYGGFWAVGGDYTTFSMAAGQPGSPLLYSSGTGGAIAEQPHLVTDGWTAGINGASANVSVFCAVG